MRNLSLQDHVEEDKNKIWYIHISHIKHISLEYLFKYILYVLSPILFLLVVWHHKCCGFYNQWKTSRIYIYHIFIDGSHCHTSLRSQKHILFALFIQSWLHYVEIIFWIIELHLVVIWCVIMPISSWFLTWYSSLDSVFGSPRVHEKNNIDGLRLIDSNAWKHDCILDRKILSHVW